MFIMFYFQIGFIAVKFCTCWISHANQFYTYSEIASIIPIFWIVYSSI